MSTTTPRYVVGIDLGTTNCALSYVDLEAEVSRVQVFQVPQLTALGEVGHQSTLPSFVYLPPESQVDRSLLRLPWQAADPGFCVGLLARDMGEKSPACVVSSAKSWLCCEGVDRRAEILPFAESGSGQRISPVTASRLLLEHLRQAWDYVFARDDAGLCLAEQEVFLTVPASFDAVARELTVEAAVAAGLRVQLLEEPQAAFYAWLHDQDEDWRGQVTAGDRVLVCDIGGGTTDFSLIAVQDRDGDLTLERVAVGDHILLGGDNMDLTLAYGVAARLQQERNLKLDPYQLSALTHACRDAKERLGTDRAEPYPLSILGRGTSLIGGTIRTELTVEQMDDLLMDGFFPQCGPEDRPQARRRVGLRTLGLDYAADPGVTRHLAAFLSGHAGAGAPTAVLFNGGVTKSDAIRKRVVSVLRSWNGGDDGEPLRVLEESSPDLAVAGGAAWYGCVRRGGGIRIKSGSARTYYIGVESSLPAVPGFAPPVEALCVVPFGMEEGSELEVPCEGIGLLVGETTEFRFMSSTVRTEDCIGTRLEGWDPSELEELPPLVVELAVGEAGAGPIGSLVPVRLRTVLTEVGTLQLWCHDTRTDGARWKLEFDVRGADRGDG